MNRTVSLLVMVMAAAAALSLTPADAAAQAPVPAPAKPTPILPLDKIKIGMTGYGLTVFHGTKIEPFPVTVISVMRDFGPKKGVIWILCSDPRLQDSGPVAGMSGSPIYLWDQGEAHDLGKGGRLIGAFAFGYSWVKGCYAGVQPIELMRQVAGRVNDNPAKAALPARQHGSSTLAAQTFAQLRVIAQQQHLTPDQTWRATAMAQLFTRHDGRDATQVDSSPAPTSMSVPTPPELTGGRATMVALPMTVTAPGLAACAAPLLAPLGLTPMQAPIGATAGFPPPGVDPAKIRIQPGGVLAIPLAWGAMDLSATGTITDVLPNGRVLGFGHSMFGEGEAAIPLATGYVHFIVPRQTGSFKLGGSAVIKGAIVRDENSAVVGIGAPRFSTAPVHIRVSYPDQPKRDDEYQVVHHQQLTPSIASMVVVQSVTADQSPAPENTIRIKGKMTFEGNRQIDIDSLSANAGPSALMMQIVPPIASMAQNPHDTVMLTSLDVDVTVEAKPRLATIVAARIDSAQVEPGETLGINVRLQPYAQPIVDKRIELKLPQSLADGRYQVVVGDARAYTALLYKNRPHLMNTTSVDDVFAWVKQVMSVPSDALFVVIQLPEPQLAVGRQELPSLPSSRKALIAAPTSTLTTPYFDSIEKTVPMDYVMTGQLAFQIEVEKKPAK